MTIAITRLDLPAARRTGDAKAARRMITIALVHPIVTEAINQARQRVGGVGLATTAAATVLGTRCGSVKGAKSPQVSAPSIAAARYAPRPVPPNSRSISASLPNNVPGERYRELYRCRFVQMINPETGNSDQDKDGRWRDRSRGSTPRSGQGIRVS